MRSCRRKWRGPDTEGRDLLGRPPAGRGHEQGGVRPILVLSHDVFNDRSGTVIALAVTSQPQRAGFPLTWQIPRGTLPKESWVKISQIRTLSTGRLGARLGRLGEDQLQDIVNGLLQLID